MSLPRAQDGRPLPRRTPFIEADNVQTKRALDDIGDVTGLLQRECRIFERFHHAAPFKKTDIATTPFAARVLGIFSGKCREVLARTCAAQQILGQRLRLIAGALRAEIRSHCTVLTEFFTNQGCLMEISVSPALLGKLLSKGALLPEGK